MWFVILQDGLPAHLQVRALQLVLALSEQGGVRIPSLSANTAALWRRFFTAAEIKTLLRSVEAQPVDNPPRFADMMQKASSQATLDDLQTKRPRYLTLWPGPHPPTAGSGDTILCLLGHAADTTPALSDGYAACFALGRTGGNLPPGCVPLGSPVIGTSFFFRPMTATSLSAKKKDVPGVPRALLISNGGLGRDAEFAAALVAGGAKEVFLFDPHGNAASLLTWPEGVHVVEPCDAAMRAVAFNRAQVVVVGAPEVHVDNHFADEARALGLIALHDMTQATVWERQSLQAATAAALAAAPTPRGAPADIVAWETCIARLNEPPTQPGRTAPERFPWARGVLVQHLRLPAAEDLPGEARRDPAWPKALVLCPGAGAANSAALAAAIAPATHVILANPENAVDLSLAMPLLCMGKTYASTFAPQRALHELMAQYADGVHIDIVHVNDAPERISAMRQVCVRLARLAQHPHLARRSEPPALLVHGAKPTPHAGPSAGRVGAQVAVDSLRRGLAAAATGLTAYWFDLEPRRRAARGRIYFYPFNDAHGLGRDEIEAPMVVGLLEQDRIDAMIHTGPFVSRSIAARARHGKRAVPIIGMLHSIHGASLGTELVLQKLEGPGLQSDCFISPSRCGATSYRGLQEAVNAWLAPQMTSPPTTSAQIEVIPYGIDAAQFAGLDRIACRHELGLDPELEIVLYMGRIDRQEKADLLPLLLAARTLLRTHPKLFLIIAGGSFDVAYADEVQEHAQALGLGHALRLMRNISFTDKRLYLGAADISVALGDCIQETYGLALLEAMAAGLPVVASDWNGYREIVRHGTTGFLVPTLWTDTWAPEAWLQRLAEGPAGYGHRDLNETVAVDLPGLVHALATLLDNRDLRLQQGQRGQTICRSEHDEIIQCAKMVDVFLRLIEEASTEPFTAAPERAFFDPIAKRFLHYASGTLQDDDLLRAPTMAADFYLGLLRMVDITDLLGLQLMTLLQSACATPRRCVEIESELAAQLKQPAALLRRHLLRALKYGFLERVGGR